MNTSCKVYISCFRQGKGEMVTWWLLGKDTLKDNKDNPPEKEYIPLQDDKDPLPENKDTECVLDNTEQYRGKEHADLIITGNDDKIFTPVEFPGTLNNHSKIMHLIIDMCVYPRHAIN